MTPESPKTSSPHGKKTQGFKNKLKILLGLLCSLLLVFVIVLSIPVYIFRVMVVMLAKLCRPDLGNVLNGVSSCLVNDYFYNKKSPRANVVISAYMYGHDISAEKLKERLMQNWIRAKDAKTGKPKFEQFQQYPERWLGFTFYKKCSDLFDINNHVYTYEQPRTKKDFFDDKDVTSICEKLLNAHYKPKTSPWEFHLVKNYKSNTMETLDPHKKTFVVILKIHHCLADGYSMLTALVEGLGEKSLENMKLPVPTFPTRNIGQKIVDCICFPLTFISELSYLSSHMFRYSPWKIPDENKKWYQNCAKSDFIPIERVKFIKRKFGVSFSSVLLHTISSAIHKSLQNTSQNELAPNGIKSFLEEEDDVNSMYCVSILPLPDHSTGLTNHATMALFDLPIRSSGDVINGLRDVDHMLKTVKKSRIPFLVPLYFSLVGSHFYPIGKFIGKQRMVSTALSNFPSIPFRIEFDDIKCNASDFLVGGMDGVTGVVILVLSYGEYIRIAVTAEQAVMSKDEITKFTDDMIDEINLLYDKASLKYNDCSTQTLPSFHIDGKKESACLSSIEVV